MAKQTGMTYQAVANLIKGKTERVSFSTLDEICRVLECNLGDILVYVEDSKNKNNKQ